MCDKDMFVRCMVEISMTTGLSTTFPFYTYKIH